MQHAPHPSQSTTTGNLPIEQHPRINHANLPALQSRHPSLRQMHDTNIRVEPTNPHSLGSEFGRHETNLNPLAGQRITTCRHHREQVWRLWCSVRSTILDMKKESRHQFDRAARAIVHPESPILEWMSRFESTAKLATRRREWLPQRSARAGGGKCDRASIDPYLQKHMLDT